MTYAFLSSLPGRLGERRRTGQWSAWLAAVALLVPCSLAQDLPEDHDLVYRHARTGYPTIHVYVWGAADLPGIWEVEDSIELVELLTAARLQGVGDEQPQIEQEATVRVYRRQAGGGDGRGLVFESPLDALLASSTVTPSLEEGDVVAVEVARSRPFTWRDVGGLIGAASSVALLIIRLVTL